MKGKEGKLNRIFIVVFIALALVVGVVAQNVSNDGDSTTNPTPPPGENSISESGSDTGNINENINEKIKKDYIKKFVEEEGIVEEDINSIEQVDLQNPPEEVKLGEEIDDTNVAIFEVKYDKQDEQNLTENKKVFVITYSGEEFKVPLELVPATAIEYLNFGETQETSESIYLNTAAGVRSSAEQGYVMMDYGSITGISTSMEFLKDSDGIVEVIVYINGEDAGLKNVIYSPSAGVQKDYDKESKGIINFQPGDVISVYVSVNGDVTWKNAINLVKIQLEE